MVLKKTAISILLVFILFCACTKEQSLPGSPVKGGSDPLSLMETSNSLPEVTSATLSPDPIVSNLPVVVRFEGQSMGNEPADFIFRWYVDDSVVQEGPNPILNPGTYKKGSSIYVEIIPSTPSVKGKPFKTAMLKVGDLAPAIDSIKLKPAQPAVGDIITAIPSGSDPDSDIVSYRYEWTVNSAVVPGLPRESNSFDTSGLQKGDIICAAVTPFDGEMSGTTTLSEFVNLVNAVPKITSSPPTLLEKGMYEYQVIAKDPDGDQLTYSLIKCPVGMTIDPSTGLVRWEPPSSITGKQEIAVEISVNDGDGGVDHQEYTLYLNIR
jgi:hypothetical protein